jgi:hypothetical protein
MVKLLYIILHEFTDCKTECLAGQYLGGTTCDGNGDSDTLTCESKFFYTYSATKTVMFSLDKFEQCRWLSRVKWPNFFNI